MTWTVDYLMSIEGGDRGGQRERELPKAGLVALEPQRDFLMKESNGGLALRRDLRNRGFDVDDVAGSTVYKGKLTGDGKQIFWVPYSRWWSHTHPVGYHVYYVPVTLTNELSPEEQAAQKRLEAAQKQAAAEAEKERKEAEERAARERKEAERAAEIERRERELRERDEQKRAADELRRQTLEDQRQRLEDARQQIEVARLQAEIDRAKRDAAGITDDVHQVFRAAVGVPIDPLAPTERPSLPPGSGFKVVEIYGVVQGGKVPFPVAVQARMAGDGAAQILATDSPGTGFGLAGDFATWQRYVPSGETLGHPPGRGVVAWDGQRPVPLDVGTLSRMLPPGWQGLVYG
ncbi:MAG: hypothetical protein U1A78_33750 [Polyangia bacterium]